MLSSNRAAEGCPQPQAQCVPENNQPIVLSFNSHHLVSAKRAVVIALFDRVNTHYREEDDDGKNTEICHLYAVLEANDYPRKFVDTLQHCRLTREKKEK